MTIRKIKFGVFAFLLLGVLLVCGTMVGRELLLRQKEKEDFEQLTRLVTVEKSPAPSASPDTPSVSALPGSTDIPEEPSAERIRTGP